jgi:tRNA uridine 5-carbamoylmethylation protein Kti12
MVKALLGKSKKPVTISDEEWEEINVRAWSAIHLCLADDVLFNIVMEKTIADLWTKLESLYKKKSLTNMIFLKRQLYSFHMKEGTKITDHLNTFNTLLVQLTSMGVKLKSKYKMITLLCSLPESWDHFVTSISFSST